MTETEVRITDVTLDAADLHKRARDREASPPAIFAQANEDFERTKRLHNFATWRRHDLIREARRLGVSWVALSRWTGLHVRTLHKIVDDR